MSISCITKMLIECKMYCYHSLWVILILSQYCMSVNLFYNFLFVIERDMNFTCWFVMLSVCYWCYWLLLVVCLMIVQFRCNVLDNCTVLSLYRLYCTNIMLFECYLLLLQCYMNVSCIFEILFELLKCCVGFSYIMILCGLLVVPCNSLYRWVLSYCET